jgi:D-glycero-alpha-D-manno-heptose-7-phosphate kinase
VIITRTPLRLSFLGGGTDYPEYYLHHGGQTLGVAIDKYSYITVKRLARLFDYSIRISYSRTELVSRVEEIEHPAVRECLRFLEIDGGLEIHYVGDLPARTGLGSSSSFTVGLLHALHAYRGEHVCARQLAEEAVYVEQKMIRERVGVQDQYTCAHGGLLNLQFEVDDKIRVQPVSLRAERLAELQAHLMLFYTGICRNAHDVLDEQLQHTKTGAITEDLSTLAQLAEQGLDVLAGRQPLKRFGQLLHQAWMVKKQLSKKISSLEIDALYNRGLEAGAAGGKLLGAGGGGFLLFFVDLNLQSQVEAALAGVPRITFKFDYSGSSLLFFQPD